MIHMEIWKCFLGMFPPKDLYIRRKVVDDIGEVCLGYHSISLTQHSFHFLRCKDTGYLFTGLFITNSISHNFCSNIPFKLYSVLPLVIWSYLLQKLDGV